VAQQPLFIIIERPTQNAERAGSAENQKETISMRR